MHHFDAGENDAGATEILEAHHGFDDAFDGTMVLFNNATGCGFHSSASGM